MNQLKSITTTLAAMLLAAASGAQAAPYNVTGNLTGFSSTPAYIDATFTPTAPTFAGIWNIDAGTLTPVGDVSFVPYSIQWSAAGLYSGTTNYTTDIYHLDTTGTNVGYDYDADTRTLTITNGTLQSINSIYSCTDAPLFCGNELPTFQFDLTLTFADAALSAFSGTAKATGGDIGGLYAYDWSFNGHAPEVPVPAAAWLFGSGLLGLAGVARRRNNI